MIFRPGQLRTAFFPPVHPRTDDRPPHSEGAIGSPQLRDALTSFVSIVTGSSDKKNNDFQVGEYSCSCTVAARFH